MDSRIPEPVNRRLYQLLITRHRHSRLLTLLPRRSMRDTSVPWPAGRPLRPAAGAWHTVTARNRSRYHSHDCYPVHATTVEGVSLYTTTVCIHWMSDRSHLIRGTKQGTKRRPGNPLRVRHGRIGLQCVAEYVQAREGGEFSATAAGVVRIDDPCSER